MSLTKSIQSFLAKTEILKRNLCCENVKYLFSDWEMDVVSLNKSGYLTEFEVKISRHDFKKDEKKRKMFHYRNCPSPAFSPNLFWYVVPFGLIEKSEVPLFAGLMYFEKETLHIIKRPKFLHKEKHDRGKILEKFCHVMQERIVLGKCALTIKNEEIRARQKQYER